MRLLDVRLSSLTLHVVFHPGKDLRKLCKNMEYTAAGKPAADSADGGGGEAPDPAA